jgi:hypothetical protein
VPDVLEPSEVEPPPADPPEDQDDDAGDGEHVDWVTVATFDEPTQAHVARLHLENEDIPCFIADENIGTMLWHYAIATGGIKLQVPREEAARAAEILAAAPTQAPAKVDVNFASCPRCGSTEIRAGRWGTRRSGATVLLVVFGFSMHPLIGLLMLACAIGYSMATRRRVCDACGVEWHEPASRGFEVVQPTPTGMRHADEESPLHDQPPAG